MDVWATVAAERRRLADQMEGLSIEQWAEPSLCGAWTVREVFAHLVVAQNVSMPAFLVAFTTARFNFDRANAALAHREANRPTSQLIADLRLAAESHRTPPGFGPEAPLTDVLVHGQDIRIPLKLDDEVSVGPWTTVLDFLITPSARRGFVSGVLPVVRYVATDCAWSHGRGDMVSGPSRAIALSMLGRTARLDELTGPGVERLRSPRAD
jgi:uncharacterized protein (TIGR03083 family)